MPVEVPFVNSDADVRILKRYHPGAEIARVSLVTVGSLQGTDRGFPALWLDPGVDGYHRYLKVKNPALDRRWEQLMEGCDEGEVLRDAASVRKVDRVRVGDFTVSILGKCLSHGPRWVTVPQLPVTGDATRNKVNRMLADATREWKEESQFKGELVLPLVFTHGDQLRRKADWGRKVKQARACLDRAGASIVWTVDADLSDQTGWSTLGERFSALVRFHEGLKEAFPKERVIAGPYWGMNLVLWVRRLCDRPAISLGSGYRYHISGGPIRTAAVRIAIPPIRRCIRAEPSLQEWFSEALASLSRSDPVYKELKDLGDDFRHLREKERARNQVAAFYQEWIARLEALPPSARALGLLQDLSSAFVVGKQLPSLPVRDVARQPASVAQQLMLNCL